MPDLTPEQIEKIKNLLAEERGLLIKKRGLVRQRDVAIAAADVQYNDHRKVVNDAYDAAVAPLDTRLAEIGAIINVDNVP